MSEQGLSVIIPAYNEVHAITDTVHRVFAVCKAMGVPFEVVVVDDGSEDGTGAAAKKAGAEVIRHPANRGYGLSLHRGIRSVRFPVIAITDADGTYPIEEYPRLYAEMDKGFDMVVGARQGRIYKGSFLKSFSRKVLKLLAEYVAGRRIPDINSGLRMFRRDAALPHLARTCFGFSFTTSLTLIFMLQGYFVGYLPIPYHTRVGKTKVRHVRDALQTMQIMSEVIVRYNPIKLFLLISVIVGLFAVVIGMAGLQLRDGLLFIGGWIMLSASLIIFSMGFLAERLGRSDQ